MGLLAAKRQSLADGLISATSNGHCLYKRFEAADLYPGESIHGFRRSQVHCMAARGITTAKVGEAA